MLQILKKVATAGYGYLRTFWRFLCRLFHRHKLDSTAMNPSLDGVRGKIDRAKAHLDDLKRVLRERPNTEASQRIRTNDQTKETVIEAIVKEAPEVPLLARLLIGDVVHCLAAALDHMVYQLSLSHQLKIKTLNAVTLCDNHHTHFPIFEVWDAKEIEPRIKKRLKLMAQAPADLIRGMQPYERARQDPTFIASQDPLWILFKLDVIDKHRVVLATNELVKPTSLTFSHPDEGPEVIEFADAEWQPFEDGAKLLEVTLGPNERPKPGVKFNLEIKAEVRFTETGLWCDGKPVVALLRILIKYIETRVIGKLAPHVV